MKPHKSGLVQRWIGGAMSEVTARTLILTATTAVLARLLSPSDFGVAALVLTVAAIFCVFVGTPYEEALAQRRVLRTADLNAALAVSLAVAVVCFVIAWPIGLIMARAYGRWNLTVLLPTATLLLFGQASLSISTAVARRRRAFNTINVASVCGHLAGAGIALLMAWCGAGLWALIGLRATTVLVSAFTLQALLGLRLCPRWSWSRVSAFHGFAVYVLMSRLLENLTYLIYNLLVGHIFGLPVLGDLNMAMRIVEPLRGAIAAFTHNVSFTYFLELVSSPDRLAARVSAISSRSALLSAPMFMGVASISPLLIPALAGPGWERAAPIAAMLAIGGMLLLPSQIALTALSAMGQPRRGLMASAIGLLTTTLVLGMAAGLDPVWIGVARLLGDAFQAVAAIALSGQLLPMAKRTLVRSLAASWTSAGLMALGVLLLNRLMSATGTPIMILVLDVLAGAALFGTIALVLARSDLFDLARAVRHTVSVRPT